MLLDAVDFLAGKPSSSAAQRPASAGRWASSSSRVVEEKTSRSRSSPRSGVQRGSTASWSSRFTSWNCAIAAVVHPQPPAVAKRVAVRPLDWRAGRRPDVRARRARERTWPCQLTEVLVVPRGLDALEHGRRSRPVPADAEAVAVRRLGAELLECRLWSMSECTGVYSSRSSSTGATRVRSQRHTRPASYDRRSSRVGTRERGAPLRRLRAPRRATTLLRLSPRPSAR